MPNHTVVATYMPKLTRSLHRCMHTSLHQYFIEDLKIPSAALLLQWNNLAASLQSLLEFFSEKNYSPLLRCFTAISSWNFFKKKSTPRYYAASLQSLWEIFSEKITPRYCAASLHSLRTGLSMKHSPRYYAASLQSLLGMFPKKN